MKTHVEPLHPRATAKLPNRTAMSLSFNSLPPTAVKIMLYLTYLWNQQQRKGAQRGGETVLRMSYRSLGTHLFPDSKAVHEHWDYRSLKAAIDALVAIKLRKSILVGKQGKQMHHWVTFLSEAWVDEDTGTIQFHLSSGFQSALEMLELEGFTLVPLKDALALEDTRLLRVFMWACTFQNLTSDGAREVPVHTIRQCLELEGASYTNWSEVWAKLKVYAKAVSALTSYQVDLETVKHGREVAAVRFNSTRRRANQ